jgi:EIN3-binding F-box protein
MLAAEIPKLLTVDLTDCKAVVDLGLRDVSKGFGRTLKEFTMGGTGITDISVDYLTSDVNPTRVDLSNCRISDESIRFISQGFPNLNRLVLKGCPLLTDSALLYLGEKLANLKHIDISDCTLISTAGVRALVEKLRELSSFHAKGCKKISGDGMKLVTANSLLKELSLSGNLFSDSGVKKTIKGCFKLSQFELHEAGLITGKSLLFIATGCPSLERLVLTGCAALVASDELVTLAEQCPILTHLELSGCAEIDSQTLLKIGTKLPHVRHLTLESKIDIHEDIVEQFLLDLPNLESLNLSGFRVTDSVANSFPVTLRSLTLKNCPKFSDAGLGKVGARCPLLQQVNLTGCSSTNDGLSRLKKSIRHLL